MKLIAVSSQNGKTVTAHAGRCRRFSLFSDETGRLVGHVELMPEEVLHACKLGADHPLVKIYALVSCSMGSDLHQRLLTQGIQVHLTRTQDPMTAVGQFLAGAPSLSCNENSGCGHTHHP